MPDSPLHYKTITELGQMIQSKDISSPPWGATLRRWRAHGQRKAMWVTPSGRTRGRNSPTPAGRGKQVRFDRIRRYLPVATRTGSRGGRTQQVRVRAGHVEGRFRVC